MLAQNYNLGARGSVNFTQTPSGPVPNIANLSDLKNFSVTWSQWELITQSLYDSAAYPAAGTSSPIQFFQNPVGQGTGFGGGTKSLSDTNMVSPGMLPQGQMFIVTSVEVDFQPTTPTGANSAYLPAAFGAQEPASLINDAYIFRRSGYLQFNVLSKQYLQEAPLMRFPATADFVADGALADATTAAATSQSRISWGTTVGQPYVLTPNNILIPSTTNFAVTLNWPEGAQAITSAARVFVRLNGLLARLAQ